MPFCANCGAQIQGNVAFCGGCGTPTSAASGAAPTTAATAPEPAPAAAVAPAANAGLADNIAGMLAYITIIPAIVFLVVEPYNKKKFIRFHSFQSIIFGVAYFIFYWIASFVLTPILGFWAAHSFLSLLGLACFVVFLVCLFKAYQGQVFKLPVIGDIAEKQANAV